MNHLTGGSRQSIFARGRSAGSGQPGRSSFIPKPGRQNLAGGTSLDRGGAAKRSTSTHDTAKRSTSTHGAARASRQSRRSSSADANPRRFAGVKDSLGGVIGGGGRVTNTPMTPRTLGSGRKTLRGGRPTQGVTRPSLVTATPANERAIFKKPSTEAMAVMREKILDLIMGDDVQYTVAELRRILRMPKMNELVWMLEWFVSFLSDTPFAVKRPYEETIPRLFQFFSFPYPIKKSAIANVAAPNAWPLLLTGLDHLADLVKTSQEFVGHCQNNIMPTLDLRVSCAFDAYSRYLVSTDALDMDALGQELLDNFREDHNMAELEEEVDNLKSSVAIRRKEFGKEKSLVTEVKLLNEDKAVQTERREQARAAVQTLEAKKADVLAKLAKRDEEIRKTEADVEALKVALSQQTLSSADVARMKGEYQCLVKACDDIHNYNDGLKDAMMREQMNVTDHNGEVAQAQQAYNMRALSLQLVPASAELAQGHDLQLPSTFIPESTGLVDRVTKRVEEILLIKTEELEAEKKQLSAMQETRRRLQVAVSNLTRRQGEEQSEVERLEEELRLQEHENKEKIDQLAAELENLNRLLKGGEKSGREKLKALRKEMEAELLTQETELGKLRKEVEEERDKLNANRASLADLEREIEREWPKFRDRMISKCEERQDYLDEVLERTQRRARRFEWGAQRKIDAYKEHRESIEAAMKEIEEKPAERDGERARRRLLDAGEGRDGVEEGVSDLGVEEGDSDQRVEERGSRQGVKESGSGEGVEGGSGRGEAKNEEGGGKGKKSKGIKKKQNRRK